MFAACGVLLFLLDQPGGAGGDAHSALQVGQRAQVELPLSIHRLGTCKRWCSLVPQFWVIPSAPRELSQSLSLLLPLLVVQKPFDWIAVVF